VTPALSLSVDRIAFMETTVALHPWIATNASACRFPGEVWVAMVVVPSLIPIGYSLSYAACKTGRLDPTW
jgi:hypothetical protein